MNLENEFVPYEQALALKELGFDEGCFKCKVIGKEHLDYTPTDYDDFPEQKEKEVLIPTFSQAFRWFREKYKLYNELDAVLTGHSQGYRFWLKNSSYSSIISTKFYKSYEEAELECLKKLIEIVKNK